MWLFGKRKRIAKENLIRQEVLINDLKSAYEKARSEGLADLRYPLGELNQLLSGNNIRLNAKQLDAISEDLKYICSHIDESYVEPIAKKALRVKAVINGSEVKLNEEDKAKSVNDDKIIELRASIQNNYAKLEAINKDVIKLSNANKELEAEGKIFAKDNKEAEWIANNRIISNNNREIQSLNANIKNILRINNVHIQSLSQFEKQNQNIELAGAIREAKEMANIISQQTVVDIREAAENSMIAKKSFNETEEASDKLGQIADESFSLNESQMLESDDHLAFLKAREDALLDEDITKGLENADLTK